MHPGAKGGALGQRHQRAREVTRRHARPELALLPGAGQRLGEGIFELLHVAVQHLRQVGLPLAEAGKRVADEAAGVLLARLGLPVLEHLPDVAERGSGRFELYE